MYQVFAEPKIRRRATAASRGVVGRKPNPKMRGDEQVPRRQPTAKRKISDIRCDAVGTSQHVIAKSSICNRAAFYKSGVHASFRGEADGTVSQKSAEGYYDASDSRDPFFECERWIHRKLRCYQLKQWGKSGYRNLRRLGVDRRIAWLTSKSPHGPWRISRTPGAHCALNNNYWRGKGLISLSAPT